MKNEKKVKKISTKKVKKISTKKVKKKKPIKTQQEKNAQLFKNPLSEDGFCLKEILVSALNRVGTKINLEKFSFRVVSPFLDQVRLFFVVKIHGTDHWADFKTGTLYRFDGSSASGSPLKMILE
jgi:hypothetical protein